MAETSTPVRDGAGQPIIAPFPAGSCRVACKCG